MITIEQYAGKYSTSPDWNETRKKNAAAMLLKVNSFIDYLQTQGVPFLINIATKSNISGHIDGGFRPQSCPVGAQTSAHKEGRAVDIHDPEERIEKYITEHADLLTKFNLYREAPQATLGWVHLTDRAPKSGRRTFLP